MYDTEKTRSTGAPGYRYEK
jgi:hypothetical protein